MAVATELDLETLKRVEQRVLWLATSIVHHANRVRENRSGVKVGGHQASSASMVSLMTALYFGVLEAPDRVSVKPHASPVLHAINHLLGRLDRSYLTKLREYGGLQSYPSRTKDPDPVDYSTGSVGLGATAPIWGALAHRYVAGHFDVPRGGRQIALIGDAELDEGACWEAIADPMVARLGEVMWVVDLNRQSLDRVVPDIAAGPPRGDVRGRGLAHRDGQVRPAPRTSAPTCAPASTRCPTRSTSGCCAPTPTSCATRIEVDVDDLDDADLLATFRDLGGHDLASLLDGYRQADAVRDRPSVVFAYTIKGWSLPTEGHPANHSALLNHEQYRELAAKLGEDADDPFAAARTGSPEAELCAATGRRLKRGAMRAVPAPKVPPDLGRKHTGKTSTQQAFGRFFVDLTREAPDVAQRVVTVSPDVGTSTNLGGWINKAGIWSVGDRIDWFADDTDTLVRWREHDHGRHIELGIAEVNLVGLLGELGATWSRDGQPLLPGRARSTTRSCRARSSRGRSASTPAASRSSSARPSGVTLGPEGGAHQSVITPSIGIEQPGCVAYEPAFGQDFEWCFLHALSQLGRPGGTSAYFRLSTRPIDQSRHTGTREAAIAGGYRLRPHDTPALSIAVMGALVPEALEAADTLTQDAGIDVEVVCITSADLLFRSFQARSGLGDGDPRTLEQLFRKGVPIVSLLDGHPHTLSFLGSPITCLGVQRFGQAGDIAELYEHHEIDAESVVGAALDLLG